MKNIFNNTITGNLGVQINDQNILRELSTTTKYFDFLF